MKFILISAVVGFGFGKLIQFKNHFDIFNNPGWCLL